MPAYANYLGAIENWVGATPVIDDETNWPDVLGMSPGVGETGTPWGVRYPLVLSILVGQLFPSFDAGEQAAAIEHLEGHETELEGLFMSDSIAYFLASEGWG